MVRGVRVHTSYLLSIFFLVSLTGCWGWGTVCAGEAYSTAGRTERSGPVISNEFIIGIKERTVVNPGPKPLPFVFHNTVDGVFAKDFTSFSWGTGFGATWRPRPLSGFIIGGTQAHFDLINNHFSFGNFQPYAQMGLTAPLTRRERDDSDGPIVTLAFQYSFLVHYLVREGEPRTDGFLAIKFGIGWEKN